MAHQEIAKGTKHLVYHIINDTHFAELLEQGKEAKVPVFVKFTGGFCLPCKKIAPVFESLSNKYRDRAYFCSIDVEEVKEVAESFNVRSIPAFHVVVDMKVKEQWTGSNSVILEQKVRKYVQDAALE